MKPETSARRIPEVVFEAVRNTAEGDLAPRNVIRRQQGDLETFIPGRIIRCGETATIEEMNLVDVRDADHRKWRINDDSRTGLLVCFATSRSGSRFTVFHETGGHRPESASRFDGAAAKEDAILPGCHATDDEPRVFIVDVAAAAADIPGEGVAGGDLEGDSSTAVRAEIDHRMSAFGMVRAV